MTANRSSATLGTLLRALVEALDGDVDAAYADAGLDYRARYTAVVRRLADEGDMRIKDLAAALGFSHSALSQTVAELRRRGWVELALAQDGRERRVTLTPKARDALPVLQQHWRAAALAAASLDADLGLQLEPVLRKALAALDARPFRDRIAEGRARVAAGEIER